MGRVLPKGEKLLVPFDSYVLFGNPTLCESKEVSEIVKQVENDILVLKEQFIHSFKDQSNPN
jgi:hypothetical protein